MIAAARGADDGVAFDVADLRDWAAAAGEPVDVLVSNATLQWVPGPPRAAARAGRAGCARAAGWRSRCPGNFDEPSHTIRRELAAEAPYADAHRAAWRCPPRHDPATYLEALAGLGCAVDAWETTYLHVLTGEDPVFTWVSGTGARPTLQALPDDLRPGFEDGVQAAAARGVPGRARTAWCCRSAASSWSPAGRRREAAPRPGRLPARRRGRRPPLLRRGLGMTEVDKPADAGGARRRWFRAYDARGAVGAELHVGVEDPFAPGPQGAPGVRLLDVTELEAAGRAAGGGSASRSTGASATTFPGHQRFHTFDAPRQPGRGAGAGLTRRATQVAERRACSRSCAAGRYARHGASAPGCFSTRWKVQRSIAAMKPLSSPGR